MADENIPNLATMSSRQSWRTRFGRLRRSSCVCVGAVQAWHCTDPQDCTVIFKDGGNICDCIYSFCRVVVDDELVGIWTIDQEIPGVFFDALFETNFHQVMNLRRVHVPSQHFITTMHGVGAHFRIEMQIECQSCQRFKRKLFMVHGNRDEERDARIAELWLSNNQRINEPSTRAQVRIIRRYADLFSRRIFRCGECMKLSYR